jgi:hypothetical protein
MVGGRYVRHSALYTLHGSRAGMTISRCAVRGEIESALVLLFSGVIRVSVVDYIAKNANKNKHSSLQFPFFSCFSFLFRYHFIVFFLCL